MAGDPEAVTPRGSSRRRFRRAAGRSHLEVASSPAIELDASDSEDAPATSRAQAKAKKADGSAVRTFVRSNARVLTAAALLVVGIVIVLLGWYGAANTNILTEQVPYLISGGLLGMALIIVSAVVGSSASLERENRELRRDMTRLLSSSGGRYTGGNISMAPQAGSDDGRVYTVPGGRSFHEAGCPIVEGKQGSEMSLQEAMDAGHSPCKLCGPD
jgi:hypothetical protein